MWCIVRIFAIFGILRKIVGWPWGSGNRRGSNKGTKILIKKKINSQKATAAIVVCVLCKRFLFFFFLVLVDAGPGE